MMLPTCWPFRWRKRRIQPGRAYRFRKTREYVLLSELAFYELSSDKNARLLMMRIPAAEIARTARLDRRPCQPALQAERADDAPACGHDQKRRGTVHQFSAAQSPRPLATEIISFVALTIGSEDRGAATDVRNARYHLRRRIVDFIESHLSDQSLSPKKIAASSRISLSYLYSLFNDNETTVSQFVQTKRLQRAYEILVADPKRHRTVSEVAYEVGFKNVSHFSRCFSRHFKVAPRDRSSDAQRLPSSKHRSAARAFERPSCARSAVSLPRQACLPYWERRPLHETV